MQREDFRHWLELPIRWGDMDALGHVNNVAFMRYLESGRVAYVEAVLGVPVVGGGAGPVLADIQCSFRRQLGYPDTIAVGTRISRIGNRSLELRCAIFRAGETEPVATSGGVMVWFDFVTQTSVPVPAHMRDAILVFEALLPQT